MNSNPKISVIVPVYKVEKYLDKCVESIVNQTYKNLEIILVDDGSPDNCPAMCDAWAEKDERIKVIHKENGGVSSARNAALEVATGDYIGFVDSDDWIEPDMYEYLVSLILDNDAQIACVQELTVDENNCSNVEISNDDEIIEKYDYIGILSHDVTPYLCTKLYSKCLFDDLPDLPTNLKMSEDAMLNHFLFKKCKTMVWSNQKKYYYFRHSESAIAGCITDRLITDSMKAYDIMEEDVDPQSEEYRYYVKNIVMSDIFLLNSVIRNQKCLDRYEELRRDILKYKSFVFDIRNKNMYKPKHLFGVFLLMICPKVYDKTITVRKGIRGY